MGNSAASRMRRDPDILAEASGRRPSDELYEQPSGRYVSDGKAVKVDISLTPRLKALVFQLLESTTWFQMFQAAPLQVGNTSPVPLR